ncbi:lipoyl(octanoyl) transferase LipB [Georgenia sp. 10Sc9-8]|uniref:Octanoyltransferase n=1 Tax=Georgenia halotolerans TaxID=3028317 RepID=A0ABT5TWA3_9MICO|nr:lipoyl(octanoyl) transferase LipB [Georgenia halotolerans]
MRFVRLDLGSRLVDYHEAWRLQRELHADVVDGAEDTVLLLEHRSVYTAGRRTAPWDRPTDGTAVVDVDRGGRITWHGPGQLVAYPLVRLPEPVDVVAYVRALEAAVMQVAAGYGVRAARVAGRSGVWVLADDTRRDRKLCAVGVRVARGVAMHGLALNACPDLTAYERIVPCGITDADVTSLSAETGREITPVQVADPLEAALAAALGRPAAHATPADGVARGTGTVRPAPAGAVGTTS